MRPRWLLETGLPALAGLLLIAALADVFAARLPYPFDLEWMEGGMLAHAWRLQHGEPLYVEPNPDFVPFVYPPGYAAVLAVLGSLVGLSPLLGRAVSLLGTLLAAAALFVGVRRQGGRPLVAGGAALAYVGAFPLTGAFLDLVRPDAVGVALMAWSVVFALDGRRGTPVVSGLLLAAAFLVKHNVALLGFPLALGLAVRDLRAAGAFVAASAGPALIVVGLLQLFSSGHFLTYLLEVPASHAMIWERAFFDSPRELGSALPLAFGAAGWFFWLQGLERQRSLPPWLAAVVPATLAVIVAWAGTYRPFPPEGLTRPLASALAYWGITLGLVGPLVRVVGTLLDRRRGRPGHRLSPEAVLGLGVAGTAVIGTLLMRAHDGGFLNVNMPALWVAAFGFGIVLTRWEAHNPALRLLTGAAVAAQLTWAWAHLDRQALRPHPEAEAIGWAFVDRARDLEGPVLSPFAAWLPVYAGKPPSIHAMAVWDLDRPGGPWAEALGPVRAALREDHWVIAFGGNHYFLGPLRDDYAPVETLTTEDPTSPFAPRTGFSAHPWRTMTPRLGVE